ncbi:MAG: sensor histidine kinase [Microthrixaceae bacterium]
MVQQSIPDESSAPPVAGSSSAEFGPTSLDLLLDRAQRAAPQLTTAADLILIAAAVLLMVADLVVWVTDPVVETGRLSVSVAVLVPCLGALAAVVLALRRRHLALAVVTLACSSMVLTILSWIIGESLPPSFAALFVLAVLTSVVLRREPSGSAILLTMLAGVAVASEALRPMVSAAAYLLVACLGAFAVAVGIGIYLRWSDWRRAAAADAARAAERLDIARELHDMVGHYVTAMVVQAQAAQHVTDHQPAAAATALINIESAGTEALAAMRRMVGGLRGDSPTMRASTWDDIDQLIADAGTESVPVRSTVGPDVRSLEPALAPSVHRIIAESLTNVRRHAQGVSSVDIALHRRGDRLVLKVHDDGAPPTPTGHDTYGIVGMRERAVSLGGSLTAGPAPGGGWVVHAELPLDDPR